MTLTNLEERSSVPWDSIRDSPGPLPFARDDNGNMVAWDPRKNSTFLLLGMSGTGKSGTADAVLSSAALLGYDLHVIDAVKSGIEFRWLAPFAKESAASLASAQVAMNDLRHELHARLELLRQHGVYRLSEIPPSERPAEMIIHVVHAAYLVQPEQPSPTCTETQRALVASDNQMRKDIAREINRVIREGRAAGMYLLLEMNGLTTHDLGWFPSLLVKDNAAVLLLGRSSAQMQITALGTFVSPEINGTTHRGRGVYRAAGADPVAVQCWWAGDTSPETTANTHQAEMLEVISAHRSRRLSTVD